jgi:Na+-driven multidrug efflux pump
MYVTVTGAVVASILDATLIYGFGLGIHGPPSPHSSRT